MALNLVFTKADKQDIDKLSELLMELFTLEVEFEANESFQKAGLKLILEDKKIGEIIVCKENDKIIAMVSLLWSISTALGGKIAVLEDMIVDKKYRNHGVGNGLLEYAISYAKDVGCKRITLLTDSDNFTAHKFYEKHGFIKSPMLTFRKKLII